VVLLELALYGIRNFTQLTRLAFKPGLNLIQGGNGSGKSTLCDILFAVVSPLSETPVESLKSNKSPDTCQAGLIFKSKNDRVCRIVRDFKNQRSSLAELDPSNKFHVTMQDEEAIEKFLGEEFGTLNPPLLEGLFSMKTAWMPSARPAAIPRTMTVLPLPVGPSNSVSPGETRTIPQDQLKKQKRLDELKILLAKSDQLSAMEDQLSDLQARSAEAKRRLRLATEKTDALTALARQGAEFDALNDLPEDYQSLLETSEQQEQLKNEQIATIDEEVEFLKQDLLTLPHQPFFFNKLFITGGGLTLLSIGLLTALDLAGLYQQLLMIVLLAGVGLMGYTGYLDFGKSNKRRRIEEKVRETERKKSHVEAVFKKENSPCVALLKKTGNADIATLRGKVKSYEQFQTTRHQMEMERDQFLGPKTLEELQQVVQSLTNQISELESKLKAASSLPTDLYLIQEEARVLERELADPPPKLDPLPPPVVSDGPPPSPSDDPAPRFLSPSFRESLESPSIQAVLMERLADIKTRMARMTALLPESFDDEMDLKEDLSPVLLTPAKSPIPWEQFSSGQQDLFHLIHQLAVIESLSPSRLFPVVMDNPLPALDPPHQQKVLDILRKFAQNKQVVFLSTVAQPNREGDHLIQLK